MAVRQAAALGQAVPASGEGLGDVTRDLGGSSVVVDEVFVDGCDPAKGGGVGFAGVGELSGCTRSTGTGRGANPSISMAR